MNYSLWNMIICLTWNWEEFEWDKNWLDLTELHVGYKLRLINVQILCKSRNKLVQHSFLYQVRNLSTYLTTISCARYSVWRVVVINQLKYDIYALKMIRRKSVSFLSFLVSLTNPYIMINDGDYETSKLHLTCDSRRHILKLVPRL